MGKTTRWFKALFGVKKSSDNPTSSSSDSRPAKGKKEWDLVWSSIGNDRTIDGNSSIEACMSIPYVESLDANKHAIAVAAATAAVAEAALAAAKAASEVVRLTSGRNRPGTAYHSCGSDRRRELAAIMIQSAFRAYLARRALRALKGLVKLQALVRGHIVRKQSANMLRRMQAMARIQARACASRVCISESSHSSSNSYQSHHHRGGTKSNIKDSIRLERMNLGSHGLDSWMEGSSWNNHRDTSLRNGRSDDENSDRILEIDSWKPPLNPKRNGKTFQTSQYVSSWNDNGLGFTTFDSLSRHPTKSQKPNPSVYSGEVSSLRSLKLPLQVDQATVWPVENSPRVHSASSRPGSSDRRGPLTPTRSECSQSFFGGYRGHPNYMANTESSRAKFRSQSAPRQRMQFDKPGSTKSFIPGFWDADTMSEKGGSTLHADFRSKAYPDTGRLDRLGTPLRGDTACYSSIYGNRC